MTNANENRMTDAFASRRTSAGVWIIALVAVFANPAFGQADPPDLRPEKNPGKSQPFKSLDPRGPGTPKATQPLPRAPTQKVPPTSADETKPAPTGSGGGGGGGGGGGSEPAPPKTPPTSPPPKGSPEPKDAPPSPTPRQPEAPRGDSSTIPFVRGSFDSANATIVTVAGNPWLVTHWSVVNPVTADVYVDLIGIDPANRGAVEATFRIPAAAFRHLPGASPIVVADLANQQAELVAARPVQFAFEQWGDMQTGMGLQSIWNARSGLNALIATGATKVLGNPIRSGEWERTPIVPMTDDCAGAPFTATRPALGTPLVGIGFDRIATPSNSKQLQTNLLIGKDEIAQTIERGLPVNDCQLFESMVSAWGNPEGLHSLQALLRENGHDVLVSWRIAQLQSGTFQTEYQPAEVNIPGSRIVAVLSESASDSLDLLIRKPATHGKGDDDGRWVDAAVRLPDPMRASGATVNVRAGQPSAARVLILEVAPAGSGSCVLRER